MKIVDKSIGLEEIKTMARTKFGNLVKAVVDIDKEIMAIDADLHADEEAALIENGSKQGNLWGINLYPEEPAPSWIEFDSMINLRPLAGNLSRGVDDHQVRDRIIKIVSKLVVNE